MMSGAERADDAGSAGASANASVALTVPKAIRAITSHVDPFLFTKPSIISNLPRCRNSEELVPGGKIISRQAVDNRVPRGKASSINGLREDASRERRDRKSTR